MARPKGPAPDTRKRILAAACDEFGAHGFAATTVDRIARRARVNKAMIYYHFPNKRALYTCIIRDVFAPITERVRDAMRDDEPPARKLERLIDALVRSVDASTYSSRSFFARSPMAGRISGAEELGLLAGIFAAVSGIIAEGAEAEVIPARPPGARALHADWTVRHVPRNGARARANQEPAAHRDSGCGYRHARSPSTDGCRRMLGLGRESGVDGVGEQRAESKDYENDQRSVLCCRRGCARCVPGRRTCDGARACPGRPTQRRCRWRRK